MTFNHINGMSTLRSRLGKGPSKSLPQRKQEHVHLPAASTHEFPKFSLESVCLYATYGQKIYFNIVVCACVADMSSVQ